MKTGLFTFLILLLFCISAQAQNDQTDDTQFLIDTTASDLSSAEPATADNAEKQLIGLGEAALPAVQKVMRENRSPQVRKLGQEVLSALESKFKMEPTLVTLKLDNVPPHEVFDELSKIGGVRAEGQWDFWSQRQQGMISQMSVNFDKVPFAQALYETGQQAHIRISQGNNQPSYFLDPTYDNKLHAYPTFLSEPMFFYVDSISRGSGIDLGSKEETDGLSINLVAITDPKLALHRVYTDAVVTEALGDTGESLIDPQHSEPTDSASWTNGATFDGQININLKFKTGQNKTIKILKGFARFAIQVAPTKVELTDLTPGKSVTVGSWTVTFKKKTPNYNGYTFHILAENSEPPSEDRQQQFPIVVSQLYDAKMLPYIAEDGGGNYQPNHFDFNVNFHPGPNGGKPHAGPPAKLVIMLANTTRIIRIPFEFTDLPIPSPTY